jgi:GT2 family glycosyltransferase
MKQKNELYNTIDLSVIFVNWNTGRLLCQGIQSVLDTVQGLETEVIVVDNSSTDGSIELLQLYFPQVRLIICAENMGFARAVNIALVEALGKNFLIAHPDVEFQPKAIGEMFSFLQSHPEVGIVGGNLLYPDGTYNQCSISKRLVRREFVEFGYPFRNIDEKITKLYKRFGKERVSLYWDHEVLTESENVWNACMMFRKELLDSIHNFYEVFFVWFADTDWCYRAKSAGWKIYYLPQAKVIHYERQSGKYLDNEQTAYKVNSKFVAEAIRKDKELLIKRHFSYFHLLLSRVINRVALSKVKIRLFLLHISRPKLEKITRV